VKQHGADFHRFTARGYFRELVWHNLRVYIMSLSRFLALTAASATSLGQQSFTSALYLQQDTHTMRAEKNALHWILRRRSYTNVLNVTCWRRLGFIFVEKHGAQQSGGGGGIKIDNDDSARMAMMIARTRGTGKGPPLVGFYNKTHQNDKMYF
jgi:hypothetical protein